MARRDDNVVDEYDRPIAGVVVTVYKGDGTLATCTDDESLPLNTEDHPITTDADGLFYYNTTAGYYRESYTRGGTRLRPDADVEVGSPSDPSQTTFTAEATTLAAGFPATASVTGEAPNFTIHLGIPTGENSTVPGPAGPAGTTGNNIIGQAIPAGNVGTNGDTYTDTSSGLAYDQKTGSVWPQGTTADVNTPWTRYDFRFGATFPSTILTLTRAGASSFATNLCYHDSPGASYSTFAANTPIVRSDFGLGIFPQSRNVFLNSTAPVTQAPTVVVGVVIVWSNHAAGVTVTTSAGTATGSGFGVVAPGTAQVLTITGAGTINVTRSGSGTWYACQVEYNPTLPDQSIATPLIITAGSAITRNADIYAITGALLTQLQASAGTVLFQTERLETQAIGARSPALFALNARETLYAASTSLLGYYDGSTLINSSIATGAWTGRIRSAAAWSGSSVTVGAGTHVATAIAAQWNNSVAVTSALLGVSDTATYGYQCLGGWLSRIEWLASRETDVALNADYTSLPFTGVLLNA